MSESGAVSWPIRTSSCPTSANAKHGRHRIAIAGLLLICSSRAPFRGFATSVSWPGRAEDPDRAGASLCHPPPAAAEAGLSRPPHAAIQGFDHLCQVRVATPRKRYVDIGDRVVKASSWRGHSPEIEQQLRPRGPISAVGEESGCRKGQTSISRGSPWRDTRRRCGGAVQAGA